MESVIKSIAFILGEIWDQAVSPVVDVLKAVHPLGSHIWWCPTSDFSLLPIHASGPYRKGQAQLADLYISSYTTTLTALIRARRPGPSVSATRGKCFLAIGQAGAIGGIVHRFVDAELAHIRQRVNDLATLIILDGSEACISRVTEELNKNEWVHLACHALANRGRPFESAFALHDGCFTIERIIQCELRNGEFAYISGCHTTMWAVDDTQTAKFISMFYDNLVDETNHLDHTRAAYALHKTMRNIKDMEFDQRINFVHLGA